MAEDRTDRPATVADLEALHRLIGGLGASIEKSTAVSRQEMKAGFVDTKMHVEVLRQEVKADLETSMHETKAEIVQLRRELADGVERVETKLLTSFHGWARTYESNRVA
jgi:uncharacterized protein (DUF885 family)